MTPRMPRSRSRVPHMRTVALDLALLPFALLTSAAWIVVMTLTLLTAGIAIGIARVCRVADRGLTAFADWVLDPGGAS